jgi:hypothetical protein
MRILWCWKHALAELEAVLIEADGRIEAVNEMPQMRIFDHKWLDPKCCAHGCQSLSVPGRYVELQKAVNTPLPTGDFDA